MLIHFGLLLLPFSLITDIHKAGEHTSTANINWNLISMHFICFVLFRKWLNIFKSSWLNSFVFFCLFVLFAFCVALNFQLNDGIDSLANRNVIHRIFHISHNQIQHFRHRRAVMSYCDLLAVEMMNLVTFHRDAIDHLTD